MKKLYAKISYNDNGSYIEPLDQIMNAMSREFDAIIEFAKIEQKWIIEIIEMEENEYENLQEFTGW